MTDRNTNERRTYYFSRRRALLLPSNNLTPALEPLVVES